MAGRLLPCFGKFRRFALGLLLMKLARFTFFLILCSSLARAQVPTTWASRGVGGGGALYSPSINPANDNEYYVSCDMSGLYHTTNFGDAYSMVNFSQTQGGHDSAVRFTNNAAIAYSLSYAGDIVFPVKTTDGGATWSKLAGNPLPFDDAYSIWADYNNPNRVILAGYSDLYLSSDGGTTFHSLGITINASNGALVGGAFFDGNNIYLGTSIGLIVSTNGGTTFSNVGLPGVPASEQLLSFAGAKAGTQTRFFCLTVAAGSVYPGKDIGADYYGALKSIYALDNGTGSWTPRMTGIDPANDFMMFVAMATNDINTVYAGGSNQASFGQVPEIMKTSDGGLHWTNVFHAANNQNINTGWSGRGGDRDWSYGEIVLGLGVAPNNSSKVVFTDLGFVHRTSDGGTTWKQAYVSPADQHPVNTTTIAGASYHSIDIENTTCWQVLWGDPQTMFACFSDIRGIRSTDSGVTWSFKYTGHTANTMYRAVKHPTTNIIYAGTSNIHDMYQSTRLANSPLDNSDPNGKIIFSSDKGSTWQDLHAFGHPVFWLALDPTAPNRMYASVIHSTAGGVFVSQDIQNGAASTWTKLPNPPRTEGHPACIVVLNDGKVLCSYSGHRTTAFTASSGVFLYNPANNTWSDVSDPGMLYWTKDVVLDPSDSAQNTWYACVFSGWGGPPNGLGGLYKTTDRGAHWTRINALDRVTSITFNPADTNEVFLTTETQGLWHTSNIHTASPVFSSVTNYPFRQPERVFYNPSNSNEVWVTSFGGGLRVGTTGAAPPPPPPPPSITQQPQSVSAGVGQSVTFTVVASGTGLSYQWYKGGTAISGATSATLTLANVQSSDAGSYQVSVTSAGGTTQSNAVTLTVGNVGATVSKLVNISTRSYVGAGGDVMIAGFVIGGTGTKTVLVRASGPALAKFSVPGVLADPTLELHDATHIIGTNDNWGDDPVQKAALLAAFQTAGAFAWDDGSKDAAALVTLNSGSYTAIVAGKNNATGTALIEVYEIDTGNNNARLINISTRSLVQTDANVQIAGFVVGGTGPRKLIIRASGPALTKYNVPGVLADPVIELHNATAIIASNDNWDASLRPDFQAVGIDTWDVGSNDAALVVTVNPGTYTAVVSGKNRTTGVALIELFEEN